jgi:hypothetical protein
MDTKIEYRVRPVTRYVVTRYESSGGSESCGSVVGKGEYDNPDIAYEVGYALAKADQERLRLPPGDTRIMFPVHPHNKHAVNLNQSRSGGAR